VGRDDGRSAGEHSAIFYKASRYKLQAHGDFWLSTVTSRPNKGWDAALPRICTWGRFKERKTGFSFYCFNLHMDHVGVTARRESAKLVLDTIRKMAGGMPVILMGDFNADQRDTTYAVLQHSSLLQDAFITAKERSGAEGTFNSFDTARHSDSRIDHLFLSDKFRVRQYAVPVIDYRGEGNILRFASDHHPVIVTVKY
jgi:endonuclease/exonuclease/phosphatase family metal-dependent hydrolase